jgi:hypothetical protein
MPGGLLRSPARGEVTAGVTIRLRRAVPRRIIALQDPGTP